VVSTAMRQLWTVAEIAARSAVLALEAAWIAVLIAGSLAFLNIGDASDPLRFAAAFMAVFGVCSATVGVALLPTYGRWR
jgi:hypothetical protein